MSNYFAIFRAVLSRRARLLLFAACASALILAPVTGLQYWYVNAQFDKLEQTHLRETIAKTTAALETRGHLDLASYRQETDLGPTDVIVLSIDSELVDVEGAEAAQQISQIAVPSISNNHLVSSLGEKWFVLKQSLKGGTCYLGTALTEGDEDPDLSKDLKACGNTISAAEKLTSRALSNTVSAFAVEDDFSTARGLMGGLPFHVQLRFPIDGPENKLAKFGLGSNAVAVVASHTVSKPSVRVIAIDNIADEKALIASYARFDIAIAVGAILLLIFVALGTLLRYEWLLQQEQISIEAALGTGESQRIEYKEGFTDERIARAIVAFSNTNNGNIFVGIRDDGTVVGIPEASNKDQDRVLQRLRDITIQRIKPSVFIKPAFLKYGDKTVLRIFVPRGAEEIYTLGGTAYIRQLTSVTAAEPTTLLALFKHSRRLIGT